MCHPPTRTSRNNCLSFTNAKPNTARDGRGGRLGKDGHGRWQEWARVGRWRLGMGTLGHTGTGHSGWAHWLNTGTLALVGHTSCKIGHGLMGSSPSLSPPLTEVSCNCTTFSSNKSKSSSSTCKQIELAAILRCHREH